MKDNFSLISKDYALYRPRYPEALYTFIFSQLKEKNCAWDAGTGNGQVASVLANVFEKVFATDISENQLKNAVEKEKITYLRQPAEATTFPDQFFDLITVAQAVHWFNFTEFNKEVHRTLKPGGVLAVFGYSLFKTGTAADPLIEDFYYNKIGKFWDPERKYIDEEYQTIPFPFKELSTPAIKMEVEWSLQELIGYLNTWSAVQHYIKDKKKNPTEELVEFLQKFWQDKNKISIYFPLILRVGRLEN